MFSTLSNGTKQLLGVTAIDVELVSLRGLLKSLDASLLGKGVAGEGSGIILLAERLVVSATSYSPFNSNSLRHFYSQFVKKPKGPCLTKLVE